jgi:hypothetical protein
MHHDFFIELCMCSTTTEVHCTVVSEYVWELVYLSIKKEGHCTILHNIGQHQKKFIFIYIYKRTIPILCMNCCTNSHLGYGLC